MQHTTGATALTLVPAIEPNEAGYDLDQWDTAIADLNLAYRDAAAARLAIEQHAQALELIEAGHVLAIEGGNAETRKAQLTRALADDAAYQSTRRGWLAARMEQADAERRIAVSRERCRLHRAALALARDE